MNFFDIAKEGDRVKLRNGAMGEITCLATGHEPIGGVIDGSGDIQWWGTHGQWNHITKVHPLDIVDIIGKTHGGELIVPVVPDEYPTLPLPHAKYDATWQEITESQLMAGDEVVMRSGLTAVVTGKGNVCITGTYTDSRGAQRHTAWHLTGFARGIGYGQDDYDIVRCFRKKPAVEAAPAPVQVLDDLNYSVNYASLLASYTTRGPDDAVIYPKALLRSGGEAVVFITADSPYVKNAIIGRINDDSWTWNAFGKSYDNDPENDIVGISLREPMSALGEDAANEVDLTESYADVVTPGDLVKIRSGGTCIIKRIEQSHASGKTFIHGVSDDSLQLKIVWYGDGRVSTTDRTDWDIMSVVKPDKPITATDVEGWAEVTGPRERKVASSEVFAAAYGNISVNSPQEPTPSAAIASVLFAETPAGVMNIAKHGNAAPVAPSPRDAADLVRDTAIELVARLMAKHDGWLPDANSIKATQTTIPGVCVIDTGAEPSPIWHRYVERAAEYVALILK